MQVLDIENHEGLPIYVHAKLTVIDDVWAAVGSANLNVRSWTHDSELAVAIVDEQRDTRAPADPGGLGDGARRFARELRLQLMREHLGLGAVGATRTERRAPARPRAGRADGPGTSAELGRLARRRLPRAAPTRPAAPAASTSAKPPPAWTRWLTTPAYRAFLDPDGRPLGMRLRRSY